MKRLLIFGILVILIPFLSIPLFSQILHVSVKDTVTNIDVKIKSIRVTNEKQGIDTTYYTPDINFGYLTSVELSSNIGKDDKCKLISSEYAGNDLILKIYCPITGNSNITISDYLGRKAAQINYDLKEGINFIIIPNITNSNTIYLVNISYSTCSSNFKSIPTSFVSKFFNELNPNKLITISPYKLDIKVEGVLNPEEEFTIEFIPAIKDTSIVIKCIIPRSNYHFTSGYLIIKGIKSIIKHHHFLYQRYGYFEDPHIEEYTKYDTTKFSESPLSISQIRLTNSYKDEAMDGRYYLNCKDQFHENNIYRFCAEWHIGNNTYSINCIIGIDSVTKKLTLSYREYNRGFSYGSYNDKYTESEDLKVDLLDIPFTLSFDNKSKSNILLVSFNDSSQIDSKFIKIENNDHMTGTGQGGTQLDDTYSNVMNFFTKDFKIELKITE